MEFESQDALSQELVLRELCKLTEYAYKTLDSAVSLAREFFVEEGEQRPLDPYLYPCLVRYYAKQIFTASKVGISCIIKDLENNGLYLIYGQYHIRIYKSDKGNVPPAGPSRVRQWFYKQDSFWSFQDLTSITPLSNKVRHPLNLILLWDVDVVKKILQLKLAVPKYGDINLAIVHWICDLEVYNSENEKQISAAYPEDLDDLDIELPEEDAPYA